MQKVAAPQFLPVPVPRVVHLIAVQQSSEWSTRRGRIRADSSMPVRFPEKPSVTTLRWKWSAIHGIVYREKYFIKYINLSINIFNLLAFTLNVWTFWRWVNGTLFSLSQWADLNFPSCHHGKRCLMRTVLKLGPNNGRNFYTCSFQKGKQCDFFQWADIEAGLSIHPGC